jgi:hypothetical protein
MKMKIRKNLLKKIPEKWYRLPMAAMILNRPLVAIQILNRPLVVIPNRKCRPPVAEEVLITEKAMACVGGRVLPTTASGW